jgi:hypothetical protein
MRTIRTVALGLAVAAMLMAESLQHILRFLFNFEGFTFALTMHALNPEMSDLAGLQILLSGMIIMLYLAVGILIASFVMPLIEDTISTFAEICSPFLTMVRSALGIRRST